VQDADCERRRREHVPASTTAVDTNTNDIVDPANGVWYHDEIFNTISANGFLP